MSDYAQLLDDLDAWAIVQPDAADAIRTLLRERDEARAEVEQKRKNADKYARAYARAFDMLEAERQRARMPEELAERLREMLYHCWGEVAQHHQAPMESLLRDILAWHEQGGSNNE